MRAPNSMSFLSKAYNFLKGKTTRNDENFYSKTPIPSEIYPVLCEPIDCKGMARNSWKGRQLLGEISNRPITDRERMKQRARLEGFSPRAVVKNYWSSKEEKKINTEIQQPQNNKVFHQEGEDEDEEGVFSIQLIKPQNGFLGIVLVGGADTPLENHYVNDILPNSSVSKSGRVRTGDELLEANGHALGGKTHAEALAIFRSLPAVVTLVVARKKNANRAILERLNHEKKEKKKVNNNIASPKKRRSVIEEAASSSVIPRTLSSVIDVTKKACPYVKPVKRASRVSSFVGTTEEVTGHMSSETEKGNQENTKENELHTLSTNPEASDLAGSQEGVTPEWSKTSDSLTLKSFATCEPFLDLPEIHEDGTTLHSTMVALRRSRNLQSTLKRRSAIEHRDVRATWPAFMTKQRLPLPWDSITSQRPATVGRSSSARVRRSIVSTSASNSSLYQTSSSARKFTGKHYIERKTITVELQRESTASDWGFTIGGGVFSPYGDLPIFIAEISAAGGAQGFLQNGDEIVDFSGESLEGATFLEAEKMLRRCARKKVTITIKRKFLQRSQNPQSNPYAEVWNSLNTTKSHTRGKQGRRPKSLLC